jgi:hypothetical protein
MEQSMFKLYKKVNMSILVRFFSFTLFIMLLMLSIQSAAFTADSDGDGLGDTLEATLGTDPNDPDTDGDGLCDGPVDVLLFCTGGEDRNLNGRRDFNETNPLDADTDDDGIQDGAEDIDGDGATDTTETNALDSDTDNDCLNDGLEKGKSLPVPSGNSNSGIAYFGTAAGWIADHDTSSITDPRDGDTDDDGLCDGPCTIAGLCDAGEDLDANGKLDSGETDPRIPNIDIPPDSEMPPVAVIDGDDTYSVANQTVRFEGGNSYDSDGSITRYFWYRLPITDQMNAKLLFSSTTQTYYDHITTGLAEEVIALVVQDDDNLLSDQAIKYIYNPGIEGPQGPKGDTGAIGPVGLQGPKGDIGISPEELQSILDRLTYLEKQVQDHRYLLEQLPQLKKAIKDLGKAVQ